MILSTIAASLLGKDDFKSIRKAVVFHDGFVAHQYLPSNELGRDFIVADLHGCHGQLMGYLLSVDFDPKKDRLILVGDLIDRGPASLACLRLLLQPWVYAVLGNHEWMLLTWLALRESNYHSAENFLPNGGEWVLGLTREEWQELTGPLAQKLMSLPLLLTVQDKMLPYHVAHGELLGEGRRPSMLKDKDLTEETVRRLSTHIAWSRRLVGEANASRLTMVGRRMIIDVEGVMMSAAPQELGLSLTYVGHNIVPRPILHRSHVYLDRGAYTHAPHAELFIVEHQRFASGLKDLGLYQ